MLMLRRSVFVASSLALTLQAPFAAESIELPGVRNGQKQVEKVEKQVESLVNQNTPDSLRQALALIETAGQNQCDSGKLHLYQARIYQQSGDDDRAILGYVEALILLGASGQNLSHQSDVLKARDGLAKLYIKRGNWDEAGGQLKKVLELSPADQTARGNLGICMMQLGFYKLAEGEFKKILNVEPRNFTALYNSGLAAIALNEPERAALLYKQAVDVGLANNETLAPMAIIGLAECKLRQGDLTGALALTGRAKKMAAQNHYVYLTEARILEKAQKPGAAIEAVKKAIEISPQDRECKLALSRIISRGTKQIAVGSKDQIR